MEAAEREVAGAEAGDGRDESNRTLLERLADAQNAQVCTDRSCCSARCEFTVPNMTRRADNTSARCPPTASLSETGCRLQMTAEGEAKAADVAAKHLAKQLADTRKALAAKQSNAGRLQQVCSGHQGGLLCDGVRMVRSSANLLLQRVAGRLSLIEAREPGTTAMLTSTEHTGSGKARSSAGGLRAAIGGVAI